MYMYMYMSTYVLLIFCPRIVGWGSFWNADPLTRPVTRSLHAVVRSSEARPSILGPSLGTGCHGQPRAGFIMRCAPRTGAFTSVACSRRATRASHTHDSHRTLAGYGVRTFLTANCSSVVLLLYPSSISRVWLGATRRPMAQTTGPLASQQFPCTNKMANPKNPAKPVARSPGFWESIISPKPKEPAASLRNATFSLEVS